MLDQQPNFILFMTDQQLDGGHDDLALGSAADHAPGVDGRWIPDRHRWSADAPVSARHVLRLRVYGGGLPNVSEQRSTIRWWRSEGGRTCWCPRSATSR